MKIALPGTRDYFAPHQIANGVPEKLRFLSTRFGRPSKKFGWDPGRAALFIDARNSFKEVDHRKILDAVVVHAPSSARYVHMSYSYVP